MNTQLARRTTNFLVCSGHWTAARAQTTATLAHDAAQEHGFLPVVRSRDAIEALRRGRLSQDGMTDLMTVYAHTASDMDLQCQGQALRFLLQAAILRNSQIDAVLMKIAGLSQSLTPNALDALLRAAARFGSRPQAVHAQVRLLDILEERKLILSAAAVRMLSVTHSERLARLGYATEQPVNSTSSEVWSERMKALPYDHYADVVRRVFDGRLLLTKTLLLELTRHAVKHAINDMDSLMDIARSRNMTISGSSWAHYMLHLTRTSRTDEAIGLVEDSRSDLYTRSSGPALRHYRVLIDGLTQACEQNLLDIQTHAEYLNRLIPHMLHRNNAQGSADNVDLAPIVDASIVRSLSRACIAAGHVSMWQGRRPIDLLLLTMEACVARHFESPGRPAIDDRTLQFTMSCLLAEERHEDMERWMNYALERYNPAPSHRLIAMFALGMWEGGDVELLYDWQRRIEGHRAKPVWPDSSQVFALKQQLEESVLARYRGRLT
ncbi:hypothetical protein PYCC9005_003511 [Savitreella phatthalungensis]